MEPFFLTIIMLGFFTCTIALVALGKNQPKPPLEALKVLKSIRPIAFQSKRTSENK